MKEKLEDERQIPFVNKKLRRKLPKINQELASRLQMELSLADPEESSSKKVTHSNTFVFLSITLSQRHQKLTRIY